MTDYSTLYPTYVVIPFKGKIDLTLNVVGLCLQEPTVTTVYLYDNNSTPEEITALTDGLASLPVGEKNVEVIPAPDLGIYEMWNAGWVKALADQNNGNCNVAILNNDIDFWPGTITEMAKILRRESGVWITYPNYDRAKSQKIQQGAGIKRTHGTYSSGGMSGWCFMVMGESIHHGHAQFDTQFEWWCGDDDYANYVEQIGGWQVRLVGWPLDHISEATASDGSNDWTHAAKGRDLVRLQQKWG